MDDSQGTAERHAPARATGPGVRCLTPGCGGTALHLEPGDLVSRVDRPGWRVVERSGTCPDCKQIRRLSVLARTVPTT